MCALVCGSVISRPVWFYARDNCDWNDGAFATKVWLRAPPWANIFLFVCSLSSQTLQTRTHINTHSSYNLIKYLSIYFMVAPCKALIGNNPNICDSKNVAQYRLCVVENPDKIRLVVRLVALHARRADSCLNAPESFGVCVREFLCICVFVCVRVCQGSSTDNCSLYRLPMKFDIQALLAKFEGPKKPVVVTSAKSAATHSNGKKECTFLVVCVCV